MACQDPILKYRNGSESVVNGVRTVHKSDVHYPCGRCPHCLKRRVDSWVFRLLQEEKVSFSSYFVTLTYDTRSVPISKNGHMTLDKADFRNFMKRLRKMQKRKIKYYQCGEYGEKKGRPHHHAIIFNVEKMDYIQEAWKKMIDGKLVPCGNIEIGKVEPNSIAYTVGYINKEKKTPGRRKDDRERQYSTMSKGLGANFLTDEMVQYFRSDLKRNFVTRDGTRYPLPRYYKEKIFSEKEKKTLAKNAIQGIESAAKEDERKIRSIYRHNPNFDYDEYIGSKRVHENVTYFQKSKTKRSCLD